MFNSKTLAFVFAVLGAALLAICLGTYIAAPARMAYGSGGELQSNLVTFINSLSGGGGVCSVVLAVISTGVNWLGKRSSSGTASLPTMMIQAFAAWMADRANLTLQRNFWFTLIDNGKLCFSGNEKLQAWLTEGAGLLLDHFLNQPLPGPPSK